MELLLRCGCVIPYDEAEPRCPQHGRVGVARVLNVPPPKIRGVATGPHVRTCDLPAFTGRIVGTQAVKD